MHENMKKKVLLSVIFGALPLSMMAQDDLYFTPKKSVKEVKSSVENVDDGPAYYSGSNRSDDEYNRMGEFASHYEVVGTDSMGNDIIEFHPGKGYEDNSEEFKYDEEDDYALSRRMSRFEDTYCPYDPWFFTHFGFGPYWHSRYYWDLYDPWYGGWHSPWYGGWYDPWYSYYGWYNSWYSPWYYNYWGWGYPYYYGYGGYWGGGYGGITYMNSGTNHGITGTSGHGHVYRPGRSGHSGGSFGGARGSNGKRSVAGKNGGKTRQQGTFGGTRRNSRSEYQTPERTSTYTPSNRSFGGSSRSKNSNFGGSSGSYGHSSGSFGGSSSGSTRSGGGGGGSHGGGFGGRR